jgi:transcriptional regulator with XRE-family HTH domain
MQINAESDLRERLNDPVFAAEFGAEYARAELSLLLTKARRERKLTQEAMAGQLGISQPYLAKLESGEANPTIGRIGRILATLGFKISSSLEPLIEEESQYRAKVTSVARVMDKGR